MEVIKVGIREFRSQLPYYLLEVGHPVAITRHGETIGYYIPCRERATADEREALEAAAQKLDALLQNSAVDTESVVDEFNTRRRKAK